MFKASMNTIFAALCILCLGIFTSISIGAVAHVLMVVAIVLFIINDPKNYWSSLIEKKHLIYSLMALMGAIGISVIFNWTNIERPLKSLLKLKYFLIPLLSVPLLKTFFNEQKDSKKIKIIFYLFFVATTVATMSGLIGLYSGFNPLKYKAACHQTRACGLYGMYMTYGYGISLFMVISTGALLYFKRIKGITSPIFLIPVWLINFAGLILSYARGGWLGFLLSAPFFAFKKSPKKFLLALVVLPIVLAGIIGLSPDLQTKLFKDRSHSNMQRISFYKASFKAFQENPVVGLGYKNLEPNMKVIKKKYNLPYPYFGADAHNIFLEALASTGIIGFACFFYFLFSWGREAYKGHSVLHDISFPFVISLCILGMVQNIFGDGENLFFIMLTWSLLAAVPNERRAQA